MKTSVYSTILAVMAVSAMPAFAQNMSSAERQKLAQNVIQADANSDGALTLTEFTKLIDLNAADKLGRAATVKKSGRYKMVFKRLDSNADGFLTKTELQAVAEQAKS